MKKKIKNINAYNLIYLIACLFPVFYVFLNALFSSISMSGITDYKEFNVLTSGVLDFVNNVNDVLGLESINTWLQTNVLHFGSSLYMFPICWLEYIIGISIMFIIFRSLMILFDICNRFGGGSNV